MTEEYMLRTKATHNGMFEKFSTVNIPLMEYFRTQSFKDGRRLIEYRKVQTFSCETFYFLAFLAFCQSLNGWIRIIRIAIYSVFVFGFFEEIDV